jgi:hypothetical protein
MVANVTQEDVIGYCGTWYRSNCGGLPTIFEDPKHIPNGSNFKDDGFVDDRDEGVIDISGIKPMDEILPLQMMVVHVLSQLVQLFLWIEHLFIYVTPCKVSQRNAPYEGWHF